MLLFQQKEAFTLENITKAREEPSNIKVKDIPQGIKFQINETSRAQRKHPSDILCAIKM